MWANSLWYRLIVSSVTISVLLLGIAGVVLNTTFRNVLQYNFEQRLHVALDGILANVELGPDAKPIVQNQPKDNLFALPLSGWYWQISDPGKAEKYTSSESLLEQVLQVPDDHILTRDKAGIAAFSIVDQQGTFLRAIVQDVKLFEEEKPYRFVVAGNFDEFNEQLLQFQQTLLLILGAIGACILAAVFWQVRYVMRPFGQMKNQLNAMRSGKSELLFDKFPKEIQPVADELNLLIKTNQEVVERARMQVGNLAHALKTPLSVLNNEAAKNKTPLAKKMREQIDIMREQVDLYLDRARRAARAQTLGASCEVEPVVDGLVRTLSKLNAAQGIKISTTCTEDLQFRGEKQDLEEMIGNLLDNACKWSRKAVHITASVMPRENDQRVWIEIIVEDDGPGIPASQRDEAMKRGKRLDETKPGSGLGMSIISETAAMYAGELRLGDSPLGGLQVRLRLPAVG